jgi:NTE family protein
MRTGVVLGAGGITGHAFHVGTLRALEELTGFDARDADVLVGTSAGSYVAASLAAGLSAYDQSAGVTGEPLTPEGQALRTAAGNLDDGPPPGPAIRRPLDPWALAGAARRPLRVRPGAVVAGLVPPGRHSSSLLQRSAGALHDGWPERDLRIVTVRVRDGRRVVLGTERAPKVDVGTAVAASCAIPGYYQPVIIDGLPHVDGGVHSPTNADVLVRDQLDLVLVLSPMSMGGGTGPRPDALVRLAFRRYLAREVAALRRRGTAVFVLQPTRADLAVMGVNPMRGERAAAVVDTVRGSVRARLETHPKLVNALTSASAQV